MVRRTISPSMKIYTPIAIGLFVSVAGSMLSTFALGLWVYQLTNSVTLYAMITAFSVLPSLFVAPFAGTLADRWDRRKLIIFSELGMSLTILVLFFLSRGGKLDIWPIYFCSAINSIFLAFANPAYSALTPMLVSKDDLGRANGINLAARAGGQIVGPLLAGVLVSTIHLQGVLLIDFASFLFPIATMLLIYFFVRLPEMHQDAKVKSSLLQESFEGARYLAKRAGLLGILILFAVINFLTGLITVLFTPLFLSFSTSSMLGTLISIGGVGMLIGSIAMGVWGGPKRRVAGIIGFMSICGVSILLCGLRPSVPLIAFAAFAYFFCFPISNGCIQVVWQSKVPSDIQGRVFALSGMVASISTPLASVLAGPLVDRAFGPLLVPGGALSGTVGLLIGVGSGRGIGLLYVVVGILTLITAAVSYVYPRIRLLEDELPDMLDFGKTNAEVSSTSSYQPQPESL
jgi:MFS transporter, DHA3 family, macrolide efflux protein